FPTPVSLTLEAMGEVEPLTDLWGRLPAPAWRGAGGEGPLALLGALAVPARR
ncbi:MAG: hypothetical protein HXY25_01130, partial [Alphaproteobacteria bacterium]|nr:hypothetical protein [Alphaproteobacteria bacterium]